MESFTHEEFITAMSMQGRTVKVTPKSLEELREKEKRQLPSSSKSVVDNWKRSQEEEDMLRERRLREERKKKAQAMAAEIRQRSTPSEPKESKPPKSPVQATQSSVPCEEIVPKVETALATNVISDTQHDAPIQMPTEQSIASTQEKEDSSCQEQAESVSQTVGQGIEEPVATIARAQVSIASAPKMLHCSASDISSISVELWWQGYIDLDLSCVSFDKQFQRSDTYFFGEQSNSDAFRHSGDILCAPPPCGAREVITVNFERINPNTQYVYFVMTAFSANDCSLVESLVIRIAEAGASQRTISGFDASTMRTKRAAVLCRICRGDNGTFSIECIDDLCFDHGETVLSLTKDIQNHLRLHP